MQPAATVPSSHDRMLRAAVRLFAQHGFAHTSTAQVAREAGTSESQLMKHFGSKEGLLAEIFEGMWRELNVEVAALLSAAESPAAGVRLLMRFVLVRLDSQPELKRLVLFEGRRVRAEGVGLTEGFREFVSRLDALLRRAKRAGAFRQPVPVPAVRSALIGAFEGLLRDRMLAALSGYPASYSPRDVERAMGAIIDTFLAE